MSHIFMQAIRAQQKTKSRFARQSKKTSGQFKRQLTDEQITSVIALLEQDENKNVIADQTGLSSSTIYNIKHRYVITSDGTVQKRRDAYGL